MFLKKLLKLFLILLFAFLVVQNIEAQQAELGNVNFPTSGSPEAQTHFLRGVAALHSFWYEEALEEFREATRIEPDFMMGYWGEAMAHNRSLWRGQDTDDARKVLLNIKKTEKLTDREQAYINAVKVLYGKGEKEERDINYSHLMEKIYRDYPEDLEAAAFYSLSLLCIDEPSEKSLAHRMKAGSIALDVYQKNPNHPGAAHYIIHAFDDPQHAIIALPAAYRYAQIAPASAHAVHMPSHIFIQLGMWENVVTSNESAWEISVNWVKNKNLSLRKRDYHSLSWLLYGYVQQGRYKKAEETIEVIKNTFNTAENEDDIDFYMMHYERMAGDFVVNSERWIEAKKLFDLIPQLSRIKTTNQSAQPGEHTEHNGMTMPSDSRKPNFILEKDDRPIIVFIEGLAAAKMDNQREAKQKAEKLRSIKEPEDDDINIMELEVKATSASAAGNHRESVKIMKRATSLEEKMSLPFGPPSLIKPSHELLGEILLKANRYKEASQAFAISLSRQPNRRLSLLGAARSASKLGDKNRAIEYYSTFLKIQAQEDLGSESIREAKNYLKQISH